MRCCSRLMPGLRNEALRKIHEKRATPMPPMVGTARQWELDWVHRGRHVPTVGLRANRATKRLCCELAESAMAFDASGNSNRLNQFGDWRRNLFQQFLQVDDDHVDA